MKIEIVYPGKIKNEFARMGFLEYLKRCRKIFEVKAIELSASKHRDAKRVVKEEGRRLEKYLSFKEYILMDVKGVEKDTNGFFKMVRSHLDSGKDLIFVVGGVYGVSEKVKKKASLTISLSRLTFTHSLSLLVLSEQIYRALKIYAGHSYDH